MENKKEYFIGLDIGTDSVGYAVTDVRYNLIKYNGEPMWGSHLFDPASQSSERRGYRTARRRLDRRQQRVALVDEIFAPEVTKIDPDFYIRKRESALYAEDCSYSERVHLYFNDDDYSEKEYYDKYPTIHHLLYDLMFSEEKKDIRLINIAIDWLVAHRGHFLSDVDVKNVDKVTDFKEVYDGFMSIFDANDEYHSYPWDRIDPYELGNILKSSGVNNKKIALKELLYKGNVDDENYFLDRKELITFIAGGKVKCSKLFKNPEYDDLTISISDDMESVLPQLGEDAEVIARLAAMYDWSVLNDILSGHKYISEAKIGVYEQHKQDLKELKRFVKTYAKDKYDEIFRMANSKLSNYVAYSYNFNSVPDGADLPNKKAVKDDFYSYLKKSLNLDKLEAYSFKCDYDRVFVEDMLARMKTGSFLPKQKDTSNRVIPYQLYYIELLAILENAKKYYSFLEECDNDGYSNINKLISVFTFKIPYYVGPLRKDNSKYSWIERKAEGKIYPWNFDKMVDLDASEEAFIRRMTNTCTYIPGEDVLPKWSLLYTKFMVLNEINNLKSNNVSISVEAKQGIYNDLFCNHVKVSRKNIFEYLVANGYIKASDELTGVDNTIKSNMKSRYDFRNLINSKKLTEYEAEKIITRRTYVEDNTRYKTWLKDNFSKLSKDDFKYLAKLKYKDFGRLSEFFLNGLTGKNKETGETGTIIYFLWNTNLNLMHLLSDRYTFLDEIKRIKQDYYLKNSMSISEQMEELGISNAVKRPVTRSLAVVKDITSSMGYAPSKIFVEMARGTTEKPERTKSRKEQIEGLYSTVSEDVEELRKQLEEMGDSANNMLQSDKLFLYYMQLGKDIYSGERINLSELFTNKYDIDHIYPQSLVKDDSILNNRVLTLSLNNGAKTDRYPIDADIRHKMYSFWKMLEHNKLITSEKFSRLIRNTPFTDEEKLGFINRQLVETRQSMKAVTQLLANLYPKSEIVYVKAKLAADFKQEYGLTKKSRIINDLHHAKDAYLNIVAGNVYNEKFTKPIARRKFNPSSRYSMNTKTIFNNDVIYDENVIWNHETDLKTVKLTYEKNNIHLTKYAYCAKGGLFDQNIVKKGNGQIEIKKGMDISKYGGYNKPSASFFVIARYLKGGKKEVSFVPIELMYSERFLDDEKFALEYTFNFLSSLNTKKIENIDFPLGKRAIKIKSVISLDGFKVWLNGKSSGGRQLLITSAESLVLSSKHTEYVRNIENYCEKRKKNKNIKHNPEHDGMSEEGNIELYDVLTEKLSNNHFSKLPGNKPETLVYGRSTFITLDFNEQISVLITCVALLKSGRAGGVDLKLIGGKSKSGVPVLSVGISSSCKYHKICLIDESPSGIHRKESINLLELLK